MATFFGKSAAVSIQQKRQLASLAYLRGDPTSVIVLAISGKKKRASKPPPPSDPQSFSSFLGLK